MKFAFDPIHRVAHEPEIRYAKQFILRYGLLELSLLVAIFSWMVVFFFFNNRESV